MRMSCIAAVLLGLLVACSSAEEETGQATSGTCDPGGACACNGDGACDKTCTGAGCALTCSGGGGCSLSCPKGGCTLTCAGGGGCRVLDCSDCTCTVTGGGGCL